MLVCLDHLLHLTLTPSLNHSLTHFPLPFLLTHPPSPSLTPTLTPHSHLSLTYSLSHLHTHLHSLIYTHAHFLSHFPLLPSLTHSLTHSGQGILLVCIGLVARLVVSVLVVTGNGFTVKEKIFIAISWLPKATVQVLNTCTSPVLIIHEYHSRNCSRLSSCFHLLLVLYGVFGKDFFRV